MGHWVHSALETPLITPDHHLACRRARCDIAADAHWGSSVGRYCCQRGQHPNGGALDCSSRAVRHGRVRHNGVPLASKAVANDRTGRQACANGDQSLPGLATLFSSAPVEQLADGPWLKAAERIVSVNQPLV